MVQYTSGSECDETPVRERNDHRAFTVQRLEFKRVCFSGLAEKPAPQLVLSAPGGGQVRRRAEWDLSYVEGIWGWSFRPGLIGDALSRLGTYHFTLTGRSAPTRRGEDDPPLTAPGEQLALSGRIVVVPGSEPRISFTYHPEPSGGFNGMGQGMRAGGKVTVQFAGYLPGSRHFLTIYGPDVAESGSKPLKDLPEVVIPPTGEATIYWKSAATVEGGLYGIWVQSTPAQPGGCNADLCETFEIRQ